MSRDASLTLEQVQAVFTEEIGARGGEVTQATVMGLTLYAKAVLTRFAEARPGDRLQAGVALTASGAEVRVQPYLFRLLCKNGAIWLPAAQSGRMTDFSRLAHDEARRLVRDAVVACCGDEVFDELMARVRESTEAEADPTRLVARRAARIAAMRSRIIDRFVQQEDRSRYGLANAVTSVARETSDPRVRWGLEELGGAVLAGDIGIPRGGGPRAPLVCRLVQPVETGARRALASAGAATA
jgi:hypothetical protein